MPLVLCTSYFALSATAQERVLDDFSSLDGWQAAPSPGVALDLSLDSGALRMDVDFGAGGGYAIARKAFDLSLPERYAFRYRVRAPQPDGGAQTVQDLEFKLVDPSGENVWWHNRRRFRYPPEWTRLATRDRHVSFAWGPRGGGLPDSVGAVEFVVTAVEGGRVTVWLDDFTFEPLLSEPDPPPPIATATSGDARAAVDGDSATAWATRDGEETLTLDLGMRRELGGVLVHWPRPPRAYTVALSDDGQAWGPPFGVGGAHSGQALIPLPESEARFVRLDVGGPSALGEATVLPVEATASPTTTLMTAAALAPPGHFPRFLAGEQGYWTVVGADGGDEEEALMGEDGHVEVRRGGPSLEPFLFHGGRLLGWYEADTTIHSLERGDLPIPTVEHRWGDLRLKVTAFVDGPAGASALVVRYRVENAGASPESARLLVALRPFQVNPPPQFLGTAGGAAEVVHLATSEGGFSSGSSGPSALVPADEFGAAPFAAGDIARWLADGTVPPETSLSDSVGLAAGALAYDLALAPGSVEEVVMWQPLHDTLGVKPPLPGSTPAEVAYWAEARQRAVAERWADRLGSAAQLLLPPSEEDLARTTRSALAYVLINRDGARIQPGSRSYDRSWIRDGALTSSALLRFGLADVATDFARWYAPFQGADGFVPCCVGRLGADWTPEHDSHGQLAFLAAEVHRYTGGDGFLREMWPHVRKAAAVIDSLRHLRMGPAYESDSLRAYYGLLPESISHEGYSAKPMHSYWDGLFALRGLKDAVYAAEALGEHGEAARLAALRDGYAADLAQSYRRAMAAHGIDYVPGSVELGDFDATSVTIAMDPVDAGAVLPENALRATFERYWQFFERRRADSTWDAYTPYEWRNVGALVRLGQPERAHEARRWFMGHRRPPAWNAFAEVVGREERRPRFVGDIPHGWVGSDFLRAVADFFCFEEGSRLVLGAGIPMAWLDEGAPVGVRGLRTHHGPLSYTMRREGSSVIAEVEGGLSVPPGGLAVRAPFGAPPLRAEVDGQPAPLSGGAVGVRALPVRVVFYY